MDLVMKETLQYIKGEKSALHKIKEIAQENDDKLHKEVEDKLKFKDSNVTFSKKNRK